MSEAFVWIDTEGGRRGQALVAAAFDLVFDDVRTGRVNDPSVTWPGDVVALDAAGATLSAEVKQRPTSDTEILQFAARLGRDGIGRGVVVVLHPSARDLDPSGLRLAERKAYGVEMSLIALVADPLGQVFLWTSLALPVALREFPRRMLVRLQDLESSADGQAEWASHFHVRLPPPRRRQRRPATRAPRSAGPPTRRAPAPLTRAGRVARSPRASMPSTPCSTSGCCRVPGSDARNTRRRRRRRLVSGTRRRDAPTGRRGRRDGSS